jgi:hypothetical protein
MYVLGHKYVDMDVNNILSAVEGIESKTGETERRREKGTIDG